MKSSTSIAQDVVLIGGGHSHAIALKQFGMNPLSGVRLTLITNVCATPYSGMLPGYVAGLYSFDDCHIDLRPLARFAGATLIVDRAIGLDLRHNRVICANHPAIAFDLLSIDIGSTPATVMVPGANEYAIPVKPISKFLHQWDQLVGQVKEQPDRPIRLGIVGGGAGGVELALAAQARLQHLYANAKLPDRAEFHLFQRDRQLLPNRHPSLGRRLQPILQQRGMQLHLGETVEAIESASPHQVRCTSGLTVPCDRVFWVTQASAAPWLQEAGLATNPEGFVLVDDTLQSISHPQVFAAGDVATMVNHPRPKAGVFAVRQGKPLYQNLRRVLLGAAPRPFTPQKEFLLLIGTGDRSAIASRGILTSLPSPLLWRWKEGIDRAFMNQFTCLTPMGSASRRERVTRKQFAIGEQSPATSYQPMPCAGCGSKVGRSALKRALSRVQQDFGWSRPDILIGLDAPDDAAVVSVPVGQVMVQTVDYFRALVADPFLLGQITTHHCLNDLFAMGATPHSALAIATLPYAREAKQEEMLYQLLSGTLKTLHQAGAGLIGGHTIAGEELAFGLTCNGFTAIDQLLQKTALQPGQVLILTKPLGTGTLFAADMQLRAKGRWIEAAIQSMLCSNQAAAQCFQAHQAQACTDITGFGLGGHLLEMVGSAAVTIELELSAIPLMGGVEATLEQKIFSSLHPQNLQAAALIQASDRLLHYPHYPILFDPQTAGGLLAALPSEQANPCLTHLQANGYPQSAIIGRVLPPQGDRPIKIVE